MGDTCAPELTTGAFVRITWPNGSGLCGFIRVADNGIVSLGFGPERDDETRWIALGHVGDLHTFVKLGSLQVISTQRGALGC